MISSEDCVPQKRMVIGRCCARVKLQELTADLQSEYGRKNCFRIARQMAREGRDVISVCCMKNMEKLLNVEND